MLAEDPMYVRRTRRREQTHQNILNAAHRLFAERGYEQTKLADIADAADLHLQTLYRHFNCKHELAAAIDREFLAEFQQQIREREGDALTFWRRWIAEATASMVELGEDYRRTLLNLFTVPAMSTTFLETWFAYQDSLAEAIAEDHAMDIHIDPRPQLTAGLFVTANTQVIRRWIQGSAEHDLVSDARATVETITHKVAPLLLD